MSEMINNREFRQKALKEMIMELHHGKTVEEVKPRFEEMFGGVSAKEITEMEQALIMDGLPVEHIQNLCDVHASVFKGSIEEIHRPEKPEEISGHPVHTFKQENNELERLLRDRVKPHLEAYRTTGGVQEAKQLLEDLELLWQIDRHYSRKENLLFPFMERYGITAPPKVMWGVDDEIRAIIKEARKLLSEPGKAADPAAAAVLVDDAMNKLTEMIYKEENILFPMVLEAFSEDDWLKVAEASSEIGYTLTEPKGNWKPAKVNVEEKVAAQEEQVVQRGAIRFDAGFLTAEEANAMLNTLPVDITFVDRDGAVKYFTQGTDRIFARPKTIIGRQVKNCHPPASVHIVEQIVEDLKSGRKDHEDFWIRMGPRYVLIRYLAVRNEKGEFLGTMEFTQDIKPIQEITGEKRLVSAG